MFSKLRQLLGLSQTNPPAMNQLIIQDEDDIEAQIDQDEDDIEAQIDQDEDDIQILEEDDLVGEMIPLLSVDDGKKAEKLPLDPMAENLKFTPNEEKLLQHKDEIISANLLLLSLHSEKFKKAACGITPLAILGGFAYGLSKAASWFIYYGSKYEFYRDDMNTQALNWINQAIGSNFTCNQMFGQEWNIVSGSSLNASANYCIQNPYNNTNNYDPTSPFGEKCIPIFNAYCEAFSNIDYYEKNYHADIAIILMSSVIILAILASLPIIKDVLKTDRMGPRVVSTLVPAEQWQTLNDLLLIFDVDYAHPLTLNDMIGTFALLLEALQTLDERINEKRAYNKARRDAFFEVAAVQDIQVDKRYGSPLFRFFKQDNCLTLTNKILDMAGLSNDFETDLKKYNKPEISEVSDEEAEKILKRNLL